MNIVLGEENVLPIREKYIVLELDTFQIGEEGPITTAFCVVENIPFEELNYSSFNQQIHGKMLSCYKSKNWKECLEELRRLKGLWGGELDSFYTEIENRLSNFIITPPTDDWTPVILKSS